MDKSENKITTQIVREEGLDKFYTITTIVDKCINTIGLKYDWNLWDIIVEPSAGNGSFLSKIPSINKIGLDILPEHKDIIKQDFFHFIPENKYKKILVVGNPPFGRVSSLAIKFFNHASTFCDVIAFIVPRTFRRISVQNKLNENFHIILDEEIPLKPCSFTPQMSVKCCFQIWEKKVEKREIIILQTTHKDWDFLQYG
jgi:predicted RNA methylase